MTHSLAGSYSGVANLPRCLYAEVITTADGDWLSVYRSPHVRWDSPNLAAARGILAARPASQVHEKHVEDRHMLLGTAVETLFKLSLPMQAAA